MHQENYFVSSKKVACYFDADFSYLENLVSKENTVLITDENVLSQHSNKLEGWKTLAIKPGEEYKQQATADHLIKELIELKADRETFIIGIGGGVVTDIAGYVASVYMRGVKFGFVPTTILAMVDASLGGKNGVDVGLYKNLVGSIRQPQFLLFDYSFLSTLPEDQWVNGFAEIIKHACIKDEKLFSYLENNSMEFFKATTIKTDLLIKTNVEIKYNIVAGDELETGDRKLLNFGHTLGHAIENIYTLPHGHAVSIGIAAACTISVQINNFPSTEKERVISLLKKYHLPVTIEFDKDKAWELLLLDKKKSGNNINFVLLNRIGEAIIKPVPLPQLKKIFNHIEL
ncbi:MAG: 3-dehydroquinate synthase [Ginsengibacter sp.]